MDGCGRKARGSAWCEAHADLPPPGRTDLKPGDRVMVWVGAELLAPRQLEVPGEVLWIRHGHLADAVVVRLRGKRDWYGRTAQWVTWAAHPDELTPLR